MKHRVLFITSSLTLPTDVSQLRLLVAGLAERFDVHVATISDSIGTISDFAHATVHSLGIGNPGMDPQSPHCFVATGQLLRQLVATLQPDIVHAWNARIPLAISWACKSAPQIKKFETVSTLSKPLGYVRNTIKRYLAPPFNKVVVPHRSLSDHLIRSGYATERIEVIGPAVPFFQPTCQTARKNLTRYLALPDSIYLACTVAPLEPRSRLKDLIWATDLLKCIRDDFHLVVVGRGRQRARLERFAFQTEAGNHVHFIDSRSHHLTASDIHAGSDVYWNSNLLAPLASPMLHSMAAGTPVISVLGHGTRDVIRHQETGLAVNFGARDEFARWTKYLIEQPAAAAQLSAQGHAFVHDTFSSERMADAYAAQYFQAVNHS